MTSTSDLLTLVTSYWRSGPTDAPHDVETGVDPRSDRQRPANQDQSDTFVVTSPQAGPLSPLRQRNSGKGQGKLEPSQPASGLAHAAPNAALNSPQLKPVPRCQPNVRHAAPQARAAVDVDRSGAPGTANVRRAPSTATDDHAAPPAALGDYVAIGNCPAPPSASAGRRAPPFAVAGPPVMAEASAGAGRLALPIAVAEPRAMADRSSLQPAVAERVASPHAMVDRSAPHPAVAGRLAAPSAAADRPAAPVAVDHRFVAYSAAASTVLLTTAWWLSASTLCMPFGIVGGGLGLGAVFHQLGLDTPPPAGARPGAPRPVKLP